MSDVMLWLMLQLGIICMHGRRIRLHVCSTISTNSSYVPAQVCNSKFVSKCFLQHLALGLSYKQATSLPEQTYLVLTFTSVSYGAFRPMQMLLRCVIAM